MSLKNNIKVNRKKITSEEIKKLENHDGLLNKHQQLTKRPIYKQKKYYFLLFFILLILLLIYFSEN